MQIIIEIDEEEYQTYINHTEAILDSSIPLVHQDLLRAVINGTPLPKGHGRLIDAGEYKEHLYACETNGRPLHIMELDERLATVDEALTIIEADKEYKQ